MLSQQNLQLVFSLYTVPYLQYTQDDKFQYLFHQTDIPLIHAFITCTSKLHYCNTLLYGLPTIQFHINKLQRVQNAAAKLVTTCNTPLICHITLVLKGVHWLPEKCRIKYKIMLLTFKCLYGLAPQYLDDLIAAAAQSRYNLRSRNATLYTCSFQGGLIQ